MAVEVAGQLRTLPMVRKQEITVQDFKIRELFVRCLYFMLYIINNCYMHNLCQPRALAEI